jgi:hypothetical protein
VDARFGRPNAHGPVDLPKHGPRSPKRLLKAPILSQGAHGFQAAGRDGLLWQRDGETLLATYEQCKPNQFPGVYTGDAPKPMMLFDLEADPAEQHDVAAEHPEVVRRLKRLYDQAAAQQP